MIKTLVFTINLLAICFFSSAQKKFPGFYTTTSGETINGSFPQFKEWKLNPAKVQFETNSKQIIELTPTICKSFTVTGFDTYEAMKVKRMTNLNRYVPNNFITNDSDTYETINVFLRKVYEGSSVKLYEFRDSKRENYFIKMNDELSELVFKVYYRQPTVIEDKKYVLQLRSLFASNIEGNKKWGDKINRLSYTERDLVSFLNTIEDTGNAKQEKKYQDEFVVIGGISINSMKVSPYAKFTVPTTISYNSNLSPVIGFSYTHYSKRNFGKNIYSAELKYYSFRNSGESVDEEWEYKAHVVSLGFNIGRKWINQKKFSWYTSLTPTIIFLANNKETRYYANTETISKGRGLLLRAGLQTGFIFKNFGIWTLYNMPIDTQTYPNYDSKHTSIQAGIDWRFPLKK